MAHDALPAAAADVAFIFPAVPVPDLPRSPSCLPFDSVAVAATARGVRGVDDADADSRVCNSTSYVVVAAVAGLPARAGDGDCACSGVAAVAAVRDSHGCTDGEDSGRLLLLLPPPPSLLLHCFSGRWR